MKCGHHIHYDCFSELVKHDARCPLCKQSVVDMSAYWQDLKANILNQPLPCELKKNLEIRCNDCLKVSQTLYHPLGNECLKCGSFNTVVEKILES